MCNCQAPSFHVDATIKPLLASKTPLWNLHEVEDVLYVRLPCELLSDYTFVSILEISPDPKYTDEDDTSLVGGITFPEGHPWLDIESTVLNLEVGEHIYKLTYKNDYTNDIAPLYFAYIIQNDDPEKPYVYMDRSGECSCGS